MPASPVPASHASQPGDRAHMKGPLESSQFLSPEMCYSHAIFTCNSQKGASYLIHLSTLCPTGEPRDRMGILIRNKNLESNFLTLVIRFQFKVPHLGEGFELNVSHKTENFKPSEVKNMGLHLTRLSSGVSLIVLLQ